MVREVRFEANLPNCTPKEFFEVIYADDVSIKIYHKLNSSEEGAVVTQWEANNRTIEFYRKIQIPKALTYIFSSNKIPVKEVQHLEIKSDEEFTISSCPEIQINIGPKFLSTTALTVRSKGEGSEVSALITCEASGPWGMISLIEGLMSNRQGVEGFLEFCENRIAETAMESDVGRAESLSEHEEFQDVLYETLSQVTVSDSPILESRDRNGMLTTEAVMLKRIRVLEEELQISKQAVQDIMKRARSWELEARRSRLKADLALVGCSFISCALLVSVICLRRHKI